MMYEWYSHSTEDTNAFADAIAQLLQPSDVLLLEGDLGAGKTTFTKALAKGLGVKRTVSSPTFTIIKEYMGRLPLYHMDVYRLENAFEDLGFEEYFYGEGVSVVEWAQFISDALPSQYLSIHISYVDETTRKFSLKPVGKHYETLCKELNI